MIANRVALDRLTTPARITLPPSFNLCGLFVDRHVEEGRSDKAMARGRTWTLSFGELSVAVCKMGNVLKSLGVKPGDRVMLFARDTPSFYVGFLGTIRVGAVVIPTNTFLRSADYGYMLADSGSKVIIAADSAMSEIEPALSHPGIAVEHRIAIDRSTPAGSTSTSCWRRLRPIARSSQQRRTRLASGSIRPARPARRRRRCTSIRTWSIRRSTTPLRRLASQRTR